jgi:hypothetical protein
MGKRGFEKAPFSYFCWCPRQGGIVVSFVLWRNQGLFKKSRIIAGIFLKKQAIACITNFVMLR